MEKATYTFTIPDNIGELFLWAYFVKLKDNRTCRECGSKEKLESHHIDKNEEKKFYISNGITLCRTCHIKYHYPNTGKIQTKKEKQERKPPVVTKWPDIDISFEATVYPIKQELLTCKIGETIGIRNLTKRDVEFLRAKLYTTKSLPLKLQTFKEQNGKTTAYITRR